MKHLNANELKKINGGKWYCVHCRRLYNCFSWWSNAHYNRCNVRYETKRRIFVAR